MAARHDRLQHGLVVRRESDRVRSTLNMASRSADRSIDRVRRALRLKEKPVSEPRAGDESPRLAGTEVKKADARAEEGKAGQSAKRKRRRKPRNRKRTETQVGADQQPNDRSQQSGGPAKHERTRDETAQQGVAKHGRDAPDGANPDEFPKRKKSKRSRRRRQSAAVRGGADPANPQQDTSAGSTPTADKSPSRPRNPRSWRKVKNPHRSARFKQAKPSDDEAAGTSGGNPPSNVATKDQAGGKRRHGGRQPFHRDAYAALDLGTNNCRLLVAVAQQPGRFRVIDAYSRIVRLGEGLGKSGRLSDDAMDRAIEALKACADKLATRTVKNVRLIATEACRRAENGREFLRRVENEAGLKLEIVDRETEARLAVAGCTSLVDRKAKGVVLFDIGGGSSELALLDLRARRSHDLSKSMVSWTSLPLGVVTLSEKHGGGQNVTRQVFNDMVEEVYTLLESYDGRHGLMEAAAEGEVHRNRKVTMAKVQPLDRS